MSNRLNAMLLASLVVVVLLLQLTGCAGVSSIQHPVNLADNTCEFDLARAGKYPWQAQQCLTICRSDKGELAYFAGCSSESFIERGQGRDRDYPDSAGVVKYDDRY